jgi:hypothetical protein
MCELVCVRVDGTSGWLIAAVRPCWQAAVQAWGPEKGWNDGHVFKRETFRRNLVSATGPEIRAAPALRCTASHQPAPLVARVSLHLRS